jgi:hypothetical protein
VNRFYFEDDRDAVVFYDYCAQVLRVEAKLWTWVPVVDAPDVHYVNVVLPDDARIHAEVARFKPSEWRAHFPPASSPRWKSAGEG